MHAVSNVSFEIGKGEVISLIGESGSGKSTIGKMMLQLTPITSGEITFNGTPVSGLKGSALKEYYRHVQGVFQDPFSSYNPIFKADRVFENVREQFFPTVDDARWDEKLRESLRGVGLNPDHVLNKFPHQLSGGQLQRLLIARALLLDVEFLVADEIISMLDASTRIDVLNLLADLEARGLSILFITHDLSLGYYISERAVILFKGYVVEMGSTDRIFGTPLHPYMRMLMASVPWLDKKWEEVEKEVKAEDAKVEVLPAGHAFFDPELATAIGDNGHRPQPVLVEVEPEHLVACFRPDDIPPI